MPDSAATEMTRAAEAFRAAAANPVPTPLPAKWVEGWVDGLNFAAAVLDVLATGKPTQEAVDEAIRGLYDLGDEAAKHEQEAANV